MRRDLFTSSVTNATISPSGANALTQNTAYSGTLTANTGFKRPDSITIKRGATTLTSGTHYTYNSTTGAITIVAAQVTAAITKRRDGGVSSMATKPDQLHIPKLFSEVAEAPITHID